MEINHRSRQMAAGTCTTINDTIVNRNSFSSTIKHLFRPQYHGKIKKKKVSSQLEQENFVIMKHSYSTNRKQAKAKRSISSVRDKLLIYLSSDVRVRTFCSNMMPSPTLLPTRERDKDVFRR